MADDDSGHEAPIRRDYVRYSGAVIGGGLLAGCAGNTGSEPTSPRSKTQSRVPDDAPTVAVFNFGFDMEGGQFYAANIDSPRNDARTFRLLGVDNAFEGDSYVLFKLIGHEALLEIDPDYIGVIGQLSYVDNETFQSTIEAAQNHETLSQLAAVENGSFLRTGGQYMGPIVDLFSTEALAMQLYPDEFGEWPGSIEDVPVENRLFDRGRVAAIVNGEADNE